MILTKKKKNLLHDIVYCENIYGLPLKNSSHTQINGIANIYLRNL